MSHDPDIARPSSLLAVLLLALGVFLLIAGNTGLGVLHLLAGGILLLVRLPRITVRSPLTPSARISDKEEGRLSLEDYVQLIQEIPVPSEQQMRDFAEFVAGAHSWYKHLPLPPPGKPFQFFLDPGAGMERAVSVGGRLSVKPRKERGFHYSWIATDEYRERFGHLAYSRSAGTRVIAVNAGVQLVPSDDVAAIYDPRRQQLAALPRKVLDEGRTEVSGIVHALSATHPILWLDYEAKGWFENWPEESGGQAGAEKIISRCRQLVESPAEKRPLAHADRRLLRNPHLGFLDYPLHEALGPERQRQLAGMVKAMRRVIQLTHGSNQEMLLSSE